MLDTKLTPDFLSVKIDEKYGQNNPHCLIEITLPKDAAIGNLNGLLELYTNSKQQPIIKIPITGEVKKVNNSSCFSFYLSFFCDLALVLGAFFRGSFA